MKKNIILGENLKASNINSFKTKNVVDQLLASRKNFTLFEHISDIPLPSFKNASELIHLAQKIIFPGFFSLHKAVTLDNLEYHLGELVNQFQQLLSKEITAALKHNCARYNLKCPCCQTEGQRISMEITSYLPRLKEILAEDVKAAKDGDPAAGDHLDEIIFCYPGLYATLAYRLAHKLYKAGVPFIPRIMTEYAHSKTGIDIHPGAQIGAGFFIDHGTGVVIGQTTIIGQNVRLYQGVTLGALSLPRKSDSNFQKVKRHPTLEDEVIVYAGATILGGETVIGERSIIGGNVWITESVPKNSKVLLKKPELLIINGNNH